MGEKQKKHFGKSAYIRSVSRAIQIFRFDFPDISIQWRVEGDFPELPEIGRSRVVTNTELLFCLFVCFTTAIHIHNTNLFCNTLSIYSLEFRWVWFVLWKVNNSRSSLVPSLPKFQNFWSNRNQPSSNFDFQFLPRNFRPSQLLTQNFCKFSISTGKRVENEHCKLFQENSLPFVPVPFGFLFAEMRLTVSPPINLGLTWLVVLMTVRRSPRELKIDRCTAASFVFGSLFGGILHVKLLPLFFFYLIVIQLGSMYKSYVSGTRQ